MKREHEQLGGFTVAEDAVFAWAALAILGTLLLVGRWLLS